VKTLLLIHFLLLSNPVSYPQPDSLISVHCDSVSFPVFSSLIEEKTGTKIYYSEAWTNRLKITLHADRISPHDALRKALTGSGLSVSPWHGGWILLRGSPLPESVPSYHIKGVTNEPSDGPPDQLTRAEEKYLTGRNTPKLETLIIGEKTSVKSTKPVVIKGRITDASSGEPVIGATMYISKLQNGTVTDINGNLTIQLVPGKYEAVFAFMGMQTKKFLLDIYSSGEFHIELDRTVIQMKELVVYGDMQMSMKKKDPGLEKISAKAVKEIPMLLGERDILKVSEMLPGIVTIGEGSSGLNVRGGNYDQNAFYLNGISIYNPTHAFGFFSSFNSDIIKDFSIYKGHIPLKYGGRLSSVFNIITRQGNRKQFTAHGGISPVAANLSVEGPLHKDKSSFLISFRSLYSDWILKRIKDPVIHNSKAGFNDASLAWSRDGKKGHWSLFAYHSMDKFKLSDFNDYSYSNDGASLEYGRNLSSKHYGSFSLSASRYTSAKTDLQLPAEGYHHAYSINDFRLNSDFTLVHGSRHTFEYGAMLNYVKLNRGTVTPSGASSMIAPIAFGQEYSLESAVYASDKMEIATWLSIQGGVRYAYFATLGPGTVYTYHPGFPRDIRYISDTISYGSKSVISASHQPDIRLALNFVTDPDGSIKLSYNQLHQNIFVLNNTIALSPDAQWKLADYHLKPANSNQLSAGIFRVFARYGMEASFETYYKKTYHTPEFLDGADLLGSPLVETSLLQGFQEAWGFEFLLKRSNQRLEGWLSYTYSRSLVRVDGINIWEKINNGNTYPANYDIPHVLNAVMNFHINRRLTTSLVLAYQSGKPVTYPVSIYYMNGLPYIEYSARNSYRIPDYFRMDLSLAIEGNLRRKKPLHNSFILGVYNLTGRQNVYSVYFRAEEGKIRSYRYSVIGVPIFTVTWSFKLGNYAAG